MSASLELGLGGLHWAPSLPALGVLILLLLVVALTVRRAWRRLGTAGAARRWGVALLNLVALAAIAALLAPPAVEREASAAVTLLTEGADEPSGGGTVFATADARIGASPRVQRLQTPGQLALRRPDLHALDVHGHGLAPDLWTELPTDLDVRFTPPPISGPVQPQWPRQLALGEALVVSGELRLPAAEQVAELRLVDPAGREVATTSARSGQAFSLTGVPRAPGALVYRLQVARGDTVLSDDPVAVHVDASRGARLLVLQSAPSFETRQLSGWAADRGHPLLILTGISRDRDLAQGVNLPADAVLELSPSVLAATDLAIVDGRRWAGMAEVRRALLLEAVQAGMGLLLLADTELAAWLETPANRDLVGLALAAIAPPDPQWPLWDGATPDRPLPIAPWRIEAGSARQLTVSENGRLLEAWRPLGEGRLGVSLLRERHGWATSGETTTFTRYWTRTLRALGREDATPRWLPPDPRALPAPGDRLTLCADPAPGLSLRARPLAAPEQAWQASLVAHTTGAPLSCGHYWPAQAGWHRAELLDANGRVLDQRTRFVFDGNEWRSARREVRQAATQARATTADHDTRRVRTPVSPWWAWGLLLLSGSLLWAERRLADLQ